MNDLLKKVFAWMSIGLLVTFATGYVVATNTNMFYSMINSYFLLAIIELVLVIVLSARITKMSPTSARIMFLLYSFVSGLTFSSIFVVYEMSSIIYVFLITAVVFAILAFLGYKTNIDLTKFGTYLMIALFAIIICALINMFVGGSTFAIIICSISILVFMGFTAYDVQKILSLEGVIEEDNLAIYGALQLYLDFINLFLDILRLFGSSRD